MNDIVIPKQKRSIEKRNAILKAGLELFITKGYYNTNTVEIAKEAGVSTGILYRYFPDKKAIFIEALESYYDVFYKTFTKELDIISNNVDIKSFLAKIIDKTFDIHNISKQVFEEIEAMMHYDNEIAEMFRRGEEFVTEKIVALLPSIGIKTNHAHEKIHVIYNLIESYVHESLYDRHECKDYNYLKNMIIDTSIYLLSHE